MRNIVLTGFMGTGKTEVGRKLATSLGMKMIDTDQLIEKEAKRPIHEIFGEEGEAHFRKLERSMIQKVVKERNAIIAVGGGAISDAENLKALQKNGFIVCLEASPGIIRSRVSGSKRPMLKGSSLTKRIRKLLDLRKASYRKADVTIDTSTKTFGEISNQIVAMVSENVMEQVRVKLPQNSYDIKIGSGILSRIGEELSGLGIKGKVAVITHPRIGKLYGRIVSLSLKKAGFQVKTLLVPDGERYKTLLTANRLYDALIKNRFERSSCLIALGGGVIGDLVGYTAATFLRGISFCQIPTSLVAQVDASIGGKTAVNHPMGKNLIGVFHQPRLVFIDTQVLLTLSNREFQSGLAEVIKYGVINDARFFEFLERRMPEILKLDDQILRRAIIRSCEIKAKVVSEDERESGWRLILNYGHTFGHALEAVGGYKRFLHGEAVAMGMLKAARMSQRLGLCGETVVKRQEALIRRAKLPISLPKFRSADILRHMKVDKKVVGGAIHFVLASRIGKVSASCL